MVTLKVYVHVIYPLPKKVPPSGVIVLTLCNDSTFLHTTNQLSGHFSTTVPDVDCKNTSRH